MTPPPEEFSLDALFDAGLTAEMRGDIDKAIECFLEVLSMHPRHGAAYLQLGKCYMKRGDVRRAGQALQRGIKVAPKSAPLRAELGILLIVMGDLKRAAIALTGARKLSKTNARALHGLIWMHALDKEWGEAVALLQQLSSAATKTFVGQYLIAMVQEAMGNLGTASVSWALAKKLCEDALEVDPAQPAVQFFLGEIQRQTVDWKTARPYYEAAAQAAPDESGCAFGLGLGVSWSDALHRAAEACRETDDDAQAAVWEERAKALTMSREAEAES